MAKNKKTSWTINLGKEDFDLENGCQPFKPVLLDGKEIYRIDTTKFMGIQRNQNKEILEAIKKHIKIELTEEELKRAFTVGIINK